MADILSLFRDKNTLSLNHQKMVDVVLQNTLILQLPEVATLSSEKIENDKIISLSVFLGSYRLFSRAFLKPITNSNILN